MITVGIHGAIGHGKTTFAESLSELEPNSAHFESSTIISEVLDELHWLLEEPFEENQSKFVNEWMVKLPPILKNIVHVEASTDQLLFSDAEVHDNPIMFQKLFEHATAIRNKPELTSQIITTENKSQYRAGLQGLGGYLVAKVSSTIWYDEVLRRIDSEKQTGIELSVIGGLRYPADAETVRKAGGIIIEIVRPDIPVKDSQDPTEAYRKQIVSDTRIINNGTLEELQLIAKSCIGDISDNSLKSVYIGREQ